MSRIQGSKRSLELTKGKFEEEVRKKQVILGQIAKLAQTSINMLVVVEYWPSLLMGYELPTEGSNMWLVSGSCPVEVQSTLSGKIHWITPGEARVQGLTERCEWVVIQGTCEFIEKTLNSWCKINSSSSCNLIILFPAKRIRKFTSFLGQISCWMNVYHSMLGGVTNSRWRMGLWNRDGSWEASDLHQFCQAYGLSRLFRDVISHVEAGRAIAKPTEELPKLIEWYSGQLEQSFILPSVFSYTGFVLRKLVASELAGVFDISEALLGKIVRDNRENITMLHTIFHKGIPPLKLSQLVINIIRSTSLDLVTPSGVPRDVPSCVKEGLLLEQDDKEMKGTAMGVEDYLAAYGQKAGKDDDSEISVGLWNRYIFEHYPRRLSYDPVKHIKALESIRMLCLTRYKRNVRRSFCTYLIKKYGTLWHERLLIRKASLLGKKRKWEDLGENLQGLSSYRYKELLRDLEVGRDCITRACNASFWEWLDGSTCFFWRWPLGISVGVRDGIPIFIQGRLPTWKKKQLLPPKSYMADKMKEKLMKVLGRRYIVDGKVLSLISCFAVPKGEKDIRLVYDGTKSKLNDSVFAPNFFMPSIDSMLMTVDVNSWFGDNDLGEMFLNYCLHSTLQRYSGVDLTSVLDSRRTTWKMWNRMFMGFCASPYIAVKLFGWCIDMIMGDRWDVKNPFRWDRVISNLPGSSAYEPWRPRVYKAWEGSISAVIEAYVDDIRSIGGTEVACKLASSRASKILQYLGQQDAARKYRPPHKRPGPWCGTFVAIQDRCVWVYVSDEKWLKAQVFIKSLLKSVSLDEEIDHSFLEKGRGFMVYFCRTYTSLTPFLKGIHLTLDGWRKGRDAEGWKDNSISNTQIEEEDKENEEWYQSDEEDDEDILIINGSKEDPTYLKKCYGYGKPTREGAPKTVVQVPRLREDIEALSKFLDRPIAPWRFVRGERVGVVHYGFGDASKSGFGATIQDGKKNLWFRLGVWSCDEESESSNYRELANLVETLEERVATDSLKGVELYVFTDNSTAEAAFYRGTSSSKSLFALVVRLKLLEVEQSCMIHIVHVAGTRMIEQGTDGLSRGDFNTGVMKGQTILSFVPIHLTCLERSPQLKDWIGKFVLPAEGEGGINFLTVEDWFERGHDIVGGGLNADGVWEPMYESGTYIWTPPPAGALVAVEQLRRARHKREASTHVILVPRLMTPEWKRQLFRVSDLCVELPFDNFVWQKSQQHEPLILAIVFPFLSHRPWQLKRTGAFLGMGRLLRGVWKDDQVSAWVILRQLFKQQRKLSDLQEDVVRKMLRGPGQFGLLYTPGGE